MVRITKDPAQRREEIIRAAQELFNNRGYEATAVSDIVKRIGVAQGTFYHYFKSKEEVAQAVLESAIAEWVALLRTITQDRELNAVQKLVRFVQEILIGPAQSEQGALEYLHRPDNLGLHQKFLVMMVQQYAPYVTTLIEQGVAEKVFQTAYPRQIAEFLLVGMQFIFDPGLFEWSEEELALKLRASLEITEKLLGMKPGSLMLP